MAVMQYGFLRRHASLRLPPQLPPPPSLPWMPESPNASLLSVPGRRRIRDRLGLGRLFRSRSPRSASPAHTVPDTQDAWSSLSGSASPSTAARTSPLPVVSFATDDEGNSLPSTSHKFPPSRSSTIASTSKDLTQTSPPTETSLRTRAHIPPISDTSPDDSALVVLWKDAISRYQKEADVDLQSPAALSLLSREEVTAYLDDQEQTFERYREGSPNLQGLRERLLPVMTILDKLCDPIGDLLSAVFPASKLIFSAVGALVKAALAVQEEFEAVSEAFDGIHSHLQVVEYVADAHPLLREASVKLLVQILVVLGVISKMRKEGRLRAWLRGLGDTAPLSKALQDLGCIATRHRDTVSAAMFDTITKIMSTLAQSTSSDMARNKMIDESFKRIIRHISESTAINRAFLQRIEDGFRQQSEDVRNMRLTMIKDDIAKWLAATPTSEQKLDKLLGDRAPETCTWFLRGESFDKFKNESLKALLIYGKAGCGKSTLIASAIQDLRTTQRGTVVLSYLFDTTDKSRSQDLRCVIASLLYALDEASDERISPFLWRLRDSGGVSLLLSSRVTIDPEVLRGIAVPIDDNEENTDIRTLLNFVFSAGGKLSGVRNAEDVRDDLIAKAEGNFRWISLLIQDLRPVAGLPGPFSRRLKALPRTLGDLYQRCLNSIHADIRDDVHRLLMWVLYSEANLSLLDFTRLLSFDYSGGRMPVYDASLQPSPEAAASFIDTMFVSVRDGVVRVAHASVKDYLLSLPAGYPFFIDSRLAYSHMARTSLAYVASADATRSDSASFDMGSHLARTWVAYIDAAGDEDYPAIELDAIAVLNLIKACAPRKAILGIALQRAAKLGQEPLVGVLLDQGADTQYFDDNNPWTALHYAANAGHLWTACLLVSRVRTAGQLYTTQLGTDISPLLICLLCDMPLSLIKPIGL
ncbi:hypothetical protein HDZ31DRAFT_65691 [Schizophyllum fasciatum]